jgi:hypothetical protein
LAAQLPMPILFESRRKKIQRFLSLPNLTIEKVWLPIVKAWLKKTFTAKSVVYLVIDRTTWGKHKSSYGKYSMGEKEFSCIF